MADDNPTRYGVDAGIGVLGLVLGIATGDKELTRSAYKATGDSARVLTGGSPQSPATSPPQFEPPRKVPGKQDAIPVPAESSASNSAPSTGAVSSGRFDPFTLEPR